MNGIKQILWLLKFLTSSLKKFLFSAFDIGPNWSFYRFTNFADSYGKSDSRPNIAKIPNSITLSKKFIDKINYLKNLTNSDGLERGLSFYVADGDLTHGKTIKGSKSRVQFSEKVSLKYIHKRGLYFDKIVELNDEKIFNKLVERKNIPAKPKIFYLMRIHTHPPHFSGSRKFYILF